MRAMPRMQVVVPADYNQAYRATIESYERDEPMYMRFGRPSTPIVYDEIPETLGDGRRRAARGQGHLDLSPCGHMVWRALEAAEALEREDGVEAEVVNVSIIKPLDSESRSSSSLAKTGVGGDRRGAPRRRRARRRGPRRSPPSSTRCRSSRVGMGDEFGVSGHRRGLHGALRAHRPRHRRPRPRGAGAEADRLAPAALRSRVDLSACHVKRSRKRITHRLRYPAAAALPLCGALIRAQESRGRRRTHAAAWPCSDPEPAAASARAARPTSRASRSSPPPTGALAPADHRAARRDQGLPRRPRGARARHRSASTAASSPSSSARPAAASRP